MTRKISDEDVARVLGEIDGCFLPLTEKELIGVRNFLQKHNWDRETVELATKRSFELAGIPFDGHAVFDPEEEAVITEKWDYGGSGYSFSLSMDLLHVFTEAGVKEATAEGLAQTFSLAFSDAAANAVDGANIPKLEIWVVPGDQGLADFKESRCGTPNPEEFRRARMWLAPMLNDTLTYHMRWTDFQDVDHEPEHKQGAKRFETQEPRWRSKGGSLVCFGELADGEYAQLDEDLKCFNWEDVISWYEEHVADELAKLTAACADDPEKVLHCERRLRREWIQKSI